MAAQVWIHRQCLWARALSPGEHFPTCQPSTCNPVHQFSRTQPFRDKAAHCYSVRVCKPCNHTLAAPTSGRHASSSASRRPSQERSPEPWRPWAAEWLLPLSAGAFVRSGVRPGGLRRVLGAVAPNGLVGPAALPPTPPPLPPWAHAALLRCTCLPLWFSLAMLGSLWHLRCRVPPWRGSEAADGGRSGPDGRAPPSAPCSASGTSHRKGAARGESCSVGRRQAPSQHVNMRHER